MSRRYLIMVIGAAALILATIILVLIINRDPELQNRVLNLANIPTNTSGGTNTNAAVVNTNAPVDPDQAARDYTARNFAESYGSGSSEDNFSNWEKAKPFATASFNGFLERTRNQQRQETLSGPYHAYLTKTLVVTTNAASATTANMTVGTQRQETIESETTTYYQDLVLDLIKVGDDWRVNAAAWKPITP